MSLLAAFIVASANLVAALMFVGCIAAWSDGRPVGRKPVIIAVLIVLSIVVQLPLPDGPSWRNVPVAFFQVLGTLT
ncbi:MAG: hypothetical protein AAGA70_01780 [Pseudomonadota bacterium]